MTPLRVLCVCRGNTCRSPMAQGVLEHRAPNNLLKVESAGTRVTHEGASPDPRGLAAASARGYDNSAQQARRFQASDCAKFDLILAMDQTNLKDLQQACPEGVDCQIRLLDPKGRDIPDPFSGGASDYEHALDMIEHAADALITEISQ